MRDFKEELAAIAETAHGSFTETHGVREQALRLSRQIVRGSANSIRATHRGEFDRARSLMEEAGGLAREAASLLEGHPSVYHAGYMEDALKEYAEASTTLSFAEGSALSGPGELGVGAAAYLNGLADTCGELRRLILDSLRRDEPERCEELLGIMDEVFSILESMDFPEAVTRGLRRANDMVRGTLERTRGDLTVALSQRRLEERLAGFGEGGLRAPRRP